MANPIQRSRVNDTDPSPYDQIFVLSEQVINKGFEEMYKNVKKVDFNRYDAQTIRTGTPLWSKRRGQRIEGGKVMAPFVHIHVEEANPAYFILFTLRFTDGDIYIRSTPPGGLEANEQFTQYKLNGWELVFKTRIASRSLDNSDPRSQAFRSTNGYNNLVFELSQLYLDTSDLHDNSGFDVSRSKFGNSDSEIRSKRDTLENLKVFTDVWLRKADENKLNVIGWAVTQPAQQGGSATFAPSIIDYAPYPWIDPGYPSPAKDGLSQNALAILTYVNRSKGSGYQAAGLRNRGVFTDNGAAFCMNRELFWDNYLLPLLQFINKDTEVVPQDPSRKFYVEVKYALGKSYSPPTAAVFSWKPQTQNGQTSWVWKGGKKEKVTNWSQNQTAYYKYTQNAQSSTEITFNAGGHDIHIKGTVVYNSKVITYGQSWTLSFHGVTHWDLPLSIGVDSNGGLLIRAGKPTVRAEKPVTQSHGWNDDQLNREGLRTLETSIKNQLQKGINKVAGKLVSNLLSLNKVFLPGAGVFGFSSGQFNKRGDLLADLKYISFDAPIGHAVDDPNLQAHIQHITKQPEGVDEHLHDHADTDPDHHEQGSHFIYDLNDNHAPGAGSQPNAHFDKDAILGDHTDDPTDDPKKDDPNQQPKKNEPTKPADNNDDAPPVFGLLDG